MINFRFARFKFSSGRKAATHSVNVVTPRGVLHDIVHLISRHSNSIASIRNEANVSFEILRSFPYLLIISCLRSQNISSFALLRSCSFSFARVDRDRATERINISADRLLFGNDSTLLHSSPSPCKKFSYSLMNASKRANTSLAVFREQDKGREKFNSRSEIPRDLFQLQYVRLLTFQVTFGHGRIGDGSFRSCRGVNCGRHGLLFKSRES